MNLWVWSGEGVMTWNSKWRDIFPEAEAKVKHAPLKLRRRRIFVGRLEAVFSDKQELGFCYFCCFVCLFGGGGHLL